VVSLLAKKPTNATLPPTLIISLVAVLAASNLLVKKTKKILQAVLVLLPLYLLFIQKIPQLPQMKCGNVFMPILCLPLNNKK
jgi:hypothetical protein